MSSQETHHTLKAILKEADQGPEGLLTEYIIELVKKWLEDKKLKRLATEAYLKPKAETDIIHRHMYFMNGSELDMLNELIKELE